MVYEKAAAEAGGEMREARGGRRRRAIRSIKPGISNYKYKPHIKI